MKRPMKRPMKHETATRDRCFIAPGTAYTVKHAKSLKAFTKQRVFHCFTPKAVKQ